MNNRNSAIDCFRGFLAISIVLYHYTIKYNESLSDWGAMISFPFQTPWGCAAVTSFFMLSGFFSAKLLYTNVSGPYILSNNLSVIKKFLFKRAIKLYPSYLISVPIVALLTYYFLPYNLISTKDIIPNLTMFPFLFGSAPVDGAYWFLRYEWFFYIILSLIVLFPIINIRRFLLLGWALLSFFLWYMYDKTDNLLLRGGHFFLIADHAGEFLMAIALYEIIKGKMDALTISLVVITFLSQIVNYDIYHILFMVITIAVLLVSFKVDFQKSHTYFPLLGIVKNVLIKYGNISYPLYLLHQMIGFGIMYQCTRYLSNGFIIFLIAFLMVSVLAYAVHKYVEEPSLGLIHK